MRALAVARLVLLRFLRGRRQLSVLGGAAVGLLLVYGILLLVLEMPFTAVVFELGRNWWLVMEALGVVSVSFSLAQDIVRTGREDGSETFLSLSGLRPSELVLGRFLGVAAVSLLVHAVMTTVLLAPAPVVRESHALVAIRFGAVLVLAVTVIPDGLLMGLLPKPGRREDIPAKLAVNLRHVLGVLLVVLIAFLETDPEAGRELSLNSLGDLMTWTIGGPEARGLPFRSPALPVAVFLLWHVGTAPFVVLGAVRRTGA